MAIVRISSVIALTALAGVLLAGCSTGSENNATVSPSPSNTATSEPATNVVSGVEAVDAYFQLAVDSCNAAMESGVVETNAVTGDKLIMIPKTSAYKDYSAVWVAADGTSEMIFEIDSFLTCGDALTFWMAEEYGERPTGYEAELSTVGGVRTARVVHSIDDEKYTTVYTVQDGKFVSADAPPLRIPEKRRQWNLVYGVPAADRALLETAVDTFLKDNQ